MTAVAFFLMTSVLAMLSLVGCTMLARFRSVGVLCGLLLTTAFFLFMAWWQPFRDHPAAVHLALMAIGVATAVGLWRQGRAAQAFGATAALTLAAWVLFSTVLFPALTRPEGLAQAYRAEIEALAAGRPYCTVSERQIVAVGYNRDTFWLLVNMIDNPSFYSLLWKKDVRPDWSSPARFFYSWTDQQDVNLLTYIRTGEPQVRLGSKHEFKAPGGLYDIIVYEWGGEDREFRQSGIVGVAAESLGLGPDLPVARFGDPRFACIPQDDFLATGGPQGMVGVSTRFGDFSIPATFRPDIPFRQTFQASYDDFAFTVPAGGLLPDVPDTPVLTFGVYQSVGNYASIGFPPAYDANGVGIISPDGLVAIGFAETSFGLLTDPALDPYANDGIDPDFVGFDAAGNFTTEIKCRLLADGSPSCRHYFFGPDLNPDGTSYITVSYPADLLPHWREIEAKAKALVSGFAVPGAIPPEKLRARPDPVCIAAHEGDCLAYDALP